MGVDVDAGWCRKSPPRVKHKEEESTALHPRINANKNARHKQGQRVPHAAEEQEELSTHGPTQHPNSSDIIEEQSPSRGHQLHGQGCRSPCSRAPAQPRGAAAGGREGGREE